MANCYARIKERMVIIMLEIELVEKITNYLDKYRIRYSKEVRMGIGVPDISINIGANKSIALISDYYLLLLVEYISEKNCATVCELSEYFSFDKPKIQSYLNQLTEEGIITQTNNIIRMKRKIFGLDLGKTISIEAKIKDWKSGILQAERYLMFSDFSYLALPEDKVVNVNQEQLKEKGIGLLSIGEKKVKEIVKPALSAECEYKQKYILTSVIIKNNMEVVKRKSDDVFSKL